MRKIITSCNKSVKTAQRTIHLHEKNNDILKNQRVQFHKKGNIKYLFLQILSWEVHWQPHQPQQNRCHLWPQVGTTPWYPTYQQRHQLQLNTPHFLLSVIKSWTQVLQEGKNSWFIWKNFLYKHFFPNKTIHLFILFSRTFSRNCIENLIKMNVGRLKRYINNTIFILFISTAS